MPRSLQFRQVGYPAVNSARPPDDRMAHGFSAVVLIHSATRERDGPGLFFVAFGPLFRVDIKTPPVFGLHPLFAPRNSHDGVVGIRLLH